MRAVQGEILREQTGDDIPWPHRRPDASAPVVFVRGLCDIDQSVERKLTSRGLPSLPTFPLRPPMSSVFASGRGIGNGELQLVGDGRQETRGAFALASYQCPLAEGCKAHKRWCLHAVREDRFRVMSETLKQLPIDFADRAQLSNISISENPSPRAEVTFREQEYV